MIFSLICFTALNATANAMDFDDCARAARHLKNAAEEAQSAQNEYETEKSNYESACSSYGYDKGNALACGPYGYHRSALDNAVSQLESKTSEVSDYASKVTSRCESASPSKINLTRFLAQELQTTKQALQDCQQALTK